MNIIMLIKMATVPSDTMLQGGRGGRLSGLGLSWMAGWRWWRRAPPTACQTFRASVPSLPLGALGAFFLPSSFSHVSRQSIPLPSECSPFSISIDKSQFAPATVKAWLPGEPEQHQNNKEEGNSFFRKGHRTQLPVLSLDDLDACTPLLLRLSLNAKVPPEAAGREEGTVQEGLVPGGVARGSECL